MKVSILLLLILYISKSYSQNAYAGHDITLCTDSTQMYANKPEEPNQGLWSVISGSANFEDRSKSNTKVKNLARGSNIFLWEIIDSTGITLDSDSVCIQNQQVYPEAEVTIENDTVFIQDTVKLNGNLPINGDGRWTLLSGRGTFTDPHNPNTTISNLGIGLTVVRWTINNGLCYSQDDISFFVTDKELSTINTNILNNELLLYPNPFKENLHFSNIKNIRNIQVFNIQGQLVKTFEFSKSNHSQELELGDLTSGIYKIRIITSNKIFNSTIVKN